MELTSLSNLEKYMKQYERKKGDDITYIFMCCGKWICVCSLTEDSILYPIANALDKEFCEYGCSKVKLVEYVNKENIKKTVDYGNESIKIGDIFEGEYSCHINWRPTVIHDNYCSVNNGTVKRWHPNGRLKGIYNYNNKVLDGPYYSYYDNGKPRHKFNYWQGIQHQYQEEYSEDGKKKKSYYCNLGKAIKDIKY